MRQRIKLFIAWWKEIHPLKRILLSTLAIILSLMIVVIIFISPIAKYVVEKYDVQWTGREITMDWAYVNPFTGFVHFSNFKVYEEAKDTIFFSAKGVSGNFEMLKLFSKNYILSDLTISSLTGLIVQKKDSLNFDDLIERFSSDSSSEKKEPVHFSILRLTIEHGEIYYRERIIPIYYKMHDLNLESSGPRWNADTIATKFSFLSQNKKGGMQGNFTINTSNLDYRLATTVRNFDLEIIRQYLWELINYGMFSAQLDARIKAVGNFRSADSLRVNGNLSLVDFHLGKTTQDDYAAFDKLSVVIDELSPANNKFLFDSITLENPFFKYEKFDSLNNVEMLFGQHGSNISDVTSQPGRFNLVIEIGRYLKKLARNFFQSHYHVNRFAITGGDLRYSDYSLSEQFTLDAKSLTIRADSVDKNKTRVGIYINSAVVPHGSLAITLSINPRDSGDFDMKYDLKKIPASMFNPYLISYTSFPLDRGTMELDGVWNVRNGDIESLNHLRVVDPRVAKRMKNKDIKWLPLPLIMAFVKERGNVIDYEIPIHGNLKNPHFRIYDVITDIIKNIFVKPVTLPYAMQVREVDNEIENALTLRWDRRQNVLSEKQKRFIQKIAKFLEKNEEATITVGPHNFIQKEKENILFFETKKKYYLQRQKKSEAQFTQEDSIAVDKMSVKDPSLVHELKRGISDTVMFTIQEKCTHFVGSRIVESRYKQLIKQRQAAFLSCFKENKTDARVKIKNTTGDIPYNGFSFFKIGYQGDVPKSLRKAYEEMNELNEENPSRHFRQDEDLIVKDPGGGFHTKSKSN